MKKTGKDLKCLNCNKLFYSPLWLLERGGGKFCSHKCYSEHKHDFPWNKGTKGKIRANNGCFTKREKKFKGTLSEYKYLHYKINKLLGSPEKCQNCQKNINLQWANKSGNYSENLMDWISLCSKCHFDFDKQEERRAKNVAGVFL